MVQAFIGLGSNVGEGARNLRTAWRLLGEISGLRLLRLSSPYATSPVGMESREWFTNAAGAIETERTPEELLHILLDIEARMGRDRKKGRDRVIDLDLLYYGARIQSVAELTLPHPELAKRSFVLAPLAEIAPDLRHPATGLTSLEMLHALYAPDQQIRKLAWDNELYRSPEKFLARQSEEDVYEYFDEAITQSKNFSGDL